MKIARHSIFFMALFASVQAGYAADQPKAQKGGVCWGSLGEKLGIDPSTEFTCDAIGKIKISQIYEKGYRVVSVMMHPKRPDIVTLVIEEQR